MLGLGLISSAIAFIVSWVLCFALVKLPVNKIFHDSNINGVQKYHTDNSIPRIGGIAILAGLIVSLATLSGRIEFSLSLAEPNTHINIYIFLILTTLAFTAGFIEDTIKDVPQFYRLILSFIAAWLFCLIFDSGFHYSGSSWVDERLLLANVWVAYPIAIFMLGGVMHSFNIIDGYNGVSCGLAIMALSGIAIIAANQGDAQIAVLCFTIVGAILGTMLFNFPRGNIFIGDGGAYMFGFLLGGLSLLLVNRNPEISPWFPLMLIALPVWETIFSIIRRRLISHLPATEPDAEHLHNLLYKRIVCRIFPEKSAIFKNSAVAPLVWCFALIGIVPAMLFWQNTPALFSSGILFILIYSLSYRLLKTRPSS